MNIAPEVRAVVDALEDPGPHPEHHILMLQRLQLEWPVLFRSLSRLQARYHKEVSW